MQQAHEADVHAHVAVQDVAELVADHALQLVARELVERAAGDGDGGVAGRQPGGEGVEPRLVLEHVDGGHRDAGGDGHLLDDIEQLALAQVGGLRVDRAPAGALGDGGSAVPHLRPLEERRQADHGDGARGDAGEQARIPPAAGLRRLRRVGGAAAVALEAAGLAEDQQGSDVAGGDGAEHGQHEQQHEPLGAGAGASLGFEEIHETSSE